MTNSIFGVFPHFKICIMGKIYYKLIKYTKYLNYAVYFLKSDQNRIIPLFPTICSTVLSKHCSGRPPILPNHSFTPPFTARPLISHQAPKLKFLAFVVLNIIAADRPYPHTKFHQSPAESALKICVFL